MPHTNDEDNIEDFADLSAINFQKIHNKITKIGYADGVANGREEIFQNSFDRGYTDGLRTAFELEKFRVFYDNVKNENCALLNEKILHKEMQIPETESAEHFQYLQHKGEILETISEHQQKYIDNYLEKFGKTLPLAMNLLSPQEKH